MTTDTCAPPPEHQDKQFHWLLVPERNMKPFPLEWDDLHLDYILNCAHECPVGLYAAGYRYVGPAIPPTEGEGAETGGVRCS